MQQPLPYGSRMKVALRNCRFFARHGVMPQERLAGNEFEVSLEVTYTPGEPVSDHLETTISYADIYEIVKVEMEVASDLLETVCARIATGLCTRWPQINRLSVAITKLTPPIPSFTGSATVTLEFFR